jgi:hypothetical protein
LELDLGLAESGTRRRVVQLEHTVVLGVGDVQVAPGSG